MTNLEMNIANLFAEVFGVSSPIYIPWGRKQEPFKPDGYRDFVLSSPDEAERKSWMGTPVLDSFTLLGDTYFRYTKNSELATISMSDFVMPYATVVEFSRAMNMSKTRVIGSVGTVTEIYGLDDWQVNIRGFCLDDSSRDSQKTAEEQMQALVMWRQVTDAVGVEGDLFRSKDIFGLVIENMNISPVQGKPHVYSFSIRAVSDEPIMPQMR